MNLALGLRFVAVFFAGFLAAAFLAGFLAAFFAGFFFVLVAIFFVSPRLGCFIVLHDFSF